jgi:hypothetical protein
MVEVIVPPTMGAAICSIWKPPLPTGDWSLPCGFDRLDPVSIVWKIATPNSRSICPLNRGIVPQ